MEYEEFVKTNGGKLVTHKPCSPCKPDSHLGGVRSDYYNPDEEWDNWVDRPSRDHFGLYLPNRGLNNEE